MIGHRILPPLVISALMGLMGLALPVAAYEIQTHAAVSEAAAERSTVGRVLREALSVNGGLKEEFSGKTLVDWTRVGSQLEDAFPRFLNHFHNPLAFWETAGLVQLGQSLILWGQNVEHNEWAWAKTRDYYHKALTARARKEREEFFAKTFRGLGHLIHLVQDAAVPAHTRADPHRAYNYESLVQDLHLDSAVPEDQAFIQRLLSDPREPDPGWKALPPHPAAPVPIARLIDTDRYLATGQFTGTNPGVTTSRLIGLAEYTNANFFSEDSAWDSPARNLLRPFVYPARSSVREADYDITLPTGDTVRRRYYQKIADGDTGYRLATVGYLKDYFVRHQLDPGRANEQPALDEMVYKDYAERLLPRAVGYSVAALDYFFRGQIEATLQGLWEQNGFFGNGFAGSIRIVNRTPEELMEGTFELYYETPDGTRRRIQSWTLTLPPNVATTLFPTWPETPDTPFTPLLLVFRGKLGNDPDAVAAAWVGPRSWMIRIEKSTFFPERTSLAPLPYPHHFLFTRLIISDFSPSAHYDFIYRDLTEAPGTRLLVSGPAIQHIFSQFTIQTDAIAHLVEFHPPTSVTELSTFRADSLPAVKRVLLTFTGVLPPTEVDITGVQFLGVLPDFPSIPAGETETFINLRVSFSP